MPRCGGAGAEPEPVAEHAPDETPRGHAPAAPRAKIFITPIARRIAAQNDIDFTVLAGSGPNGRIQRADVERAIAARDAAGAIPAAQATGDRAVRGTIPYKGMRRAIGENMMRSLAVNAPNTMFGDLDLTIMAKYRDNFVAYEAKLSTRITYADLMIHAVSRALRQAPLLNSSLIGDEIVLWDEINVGMAVALGERGDKGLVVPVIRHADRLSLVEISKTAKRLGKAAREGRLAPEERAGGTFTVSNFGSLGVSAYSTPIINVPESAILGIGRLTERPIVRNGGIVVAPMQPYSLTHDHRVIDGAAAEHFLHALKGIVESTRAELSELILF